MANFKYIFKNSVIAHEGGYANDPSDSGKETYMGISRRWYSLWNGWVIIDSYKDSVSFPSILSSDDKLYLLVKDFYKKRYWDKLHLDDIRSTIIAQKLFDSSINMGRTVTIRFFQRAINALNYRLTVNGEIVRLFEDLEVDGRIGPVTIASYNALYDRDEDIIFKILDSLQGNRYMEICEANELQRRFVRGWFINRIGD